jgi:hypothetical protein
VGGALTPTQAEGTAAILQRAADGGLPVLIPGALELRVGPPAAPPTAAPEPLRPRAAAADDRDRLENERAGGGAPAERTGAPRTMLDRLWHYALPFTRPKR